MDDCQYSEYNLRAKLPGCQEPFVTVYHTVDDEGFVSAMPFKADQLNVKPQRVAVAKEVACGYINIAEEQTSPPEYLKEGELVALMDEHGIGTDASMAMHIDNVVARNYVMVCGPSERGDGKPGPRVIDKPMKGKGKGKGKGPEQPKSRHMVPTGLGLAILDMFMTLTPDMCEPPVRAYMEKEVSQVAEGSGSKDEVLTENL